MARTLMAKTQTWHEFNANGSTRDPHCCGCWNIFHDDERGWPVGVCNECGEEREMLLECRPANK